MDTRLVRRQNVRRLIDERFGGRQVDFANAIERQADYVSRCLRGKKNIGEDLARDIEQKLHLASGWLDQDHDGERITRTITRETNVLVDLYEGLDEEGRRTLREVGAALAAAKRAQRLDRTGDGKK